MAAVFSLLVLIGANVGISVWRHFESRRTEHGAGQIILIILTVLIAILDAVVIWFIVMLFFAFDMHWYTRLCYIVAGLLILLFLTLLMTGKLTNRRLVCWCIAALLTTGATIGFYQYDRYLETIKVPEYFSYTTYTPFMEDTLAVTLDEKPSLTFAGTDDLPKMDGATALYPVYAAFAQAVYPDLNGKELVDILETVKCGTTTFAYEAIVDRECDIIFVGGPSKEQEAYAEKKGVSLVYTPIGREAFVFFVHPDNPVDSMTMDQIRGIYSGTITKWNELGAKGLGKIKAYQRDEGSGSQTALLRFVMRDTPVMPADKETVVDGMGGILEQVSPYRNHKNAIGFSFRFYCTALMKDFYVKLLSIDGVAPTVANIENGTYPLASEFYAVTRSDADENTLKLLAWIQGPQGQSLVAKSGYTPLASGN